MQNLSNLKGQLSISELQNVDEAQFACEANLSSKSGLDNLELKWSSDFNECSRKKDVETEVLNLLRPHEDLKALSIEYYAGTTFPYWIEDLSFKNLQRLKFKNCQNCTLLPAVGKLPLLKDLYIEGMSSVTIIGKEFYGESWPDAFPSLETLHFKDMPKWKEWKPSEVIERGRNLCCLRELGVSNCPKLVGILPDCLPCLEKLVVYKCQELVVPISNLPALCELEIEGAKEVVLGRYDDLWSVKKISLRAVATFACVTKEMVGLESMKVEDLDLNGCEELASSWQTKWRWFTSLKSLRHLRFENHHQVVCIGGATKEEENAQLLQLDMPCNIEILDIISCDDLEKLSKSLHNLTCLGKLEIVKCPKLVSLSTDNLPATLKILEIRSCENLQCLFDDAENINFSSRSLIQYLQISSCPALKSLSSSGKLPVGLKKLAIFECQELKFVAQEIGDNTCLESIIIDFANITYFPQGLDKLNNLNYFHLSKCWNLVCFPECGLPAANLKRVKIHECEKLEALPNLYSLQLQELHISRCPKMKSIGDGGLPTYLKLLIISQPIISKAVMEWGLNRFTSLTELWFDGSNCVDVMSFPQEEMRMNMKLPSSLIKLYIRNFKNLRKLSSKGFQNLASLRSLSVFNCSKLKSLPKKEMLSSLSELHIGSCPLLKTRCQRDKGKLWSNIAHIPCVRIDGKFIYL